MDTNIVQIITETINQSKDVIKQGADFAKEQIPLTVQEFLSWSFWSDIGTMVVCLFFIFSIIYCLVRFNKKLN